MCKAFLYSGRICIWEAMTGRMKNDVLGAICTKNIVKRLLDIVFPNKYKDFNDVFNKTEANKLLPYLIHDLTIKTQEDKIFFLVLCMTNLS